MKTHALVLLLVLFISGCSSTALTRMFKHYSAANHTSYQQLVKGDYTQALDKYQAGLGGDFLENAEMGRLTLLTGEIKQGQALLKKADEALVEQQRQAQIRVSEGASQLGALFLNDSVLDYVPPSYEVGYLHLYLAYTYLLQNDLEGALVEVRRANQVQERALLDRQKQLNATQQRLQKEGLASNVGAVISRYPDAGDLLAATQNSYLMFLSALLYEADNDLNSAYIEYRRALAVIPDNPVVIDANLRLARRLGMTDDLRLLEQRYGPREKADAHQGTIVVIDEQKVIQALDSWQVPLVLWDRNGYDVIYNLSLPYYPNQPPSYYSPLHLNDIAMTQFQLSNVDTMANQALKENMLLTVTRQALRIIAKEQVRQAAVSNTSNDYKQLSNVVINIFNVLTEQADTRSWQSLPSMVMVSQQQVEAGDVKLTSDRHEWVVPVRAGRTTLLWVSRQSGSAIGWYKVLGENR
ncbi:COG3014 family protein [Thaumasiovibrio sp. DFM-14]|uniref:COG3014 family protein n=1 Tax=Thaumasiovibrio sp. DFM-14 TaxID=3384792 RepID=UPI0039A1CFE5